MRSSTAVEEVSYGRSSSNSSQRQPRIPLRRSRSRAHRDSLVGFHHFEHGEAHDSQPAEIDRGLETRRRDNRFITMPFVIEGAFQAGVASLVSLGLLFGIYALTRASSRSCVPEAGKIALYVVTCILLGSIGSLASLRRHLKL